MFRVRKQIGYTQELISSIKENRIVVAMLDTGVAEHPDFENRIIAFKDFVNGREKPYDDSGHGTHVAGCMCGSGRISGGMYKGIASESFLFVGKVLDEKGDGMVEKMLSGIDWILENKDRYHIRILNISIGIGEKAGENRIKPLLEKIDEAWNCGLIVVCAAGNGGPKSMTLSPIGAGRKVITVGCHEDGYFGDREDLCENYSGRGPSPYDMRKPDIVAPGTDIVSCNAFFERRRNRYYNAYIKKSGTSMATPIVSGAMALLLQKHPEYTNEQVKRKLQNTARDLHEPWCKQGYGMIDLNSLLT